MKHWNDELTSYYIPIFFVAISNKFPIYQVQITLNILYLTTIHYENTHLGSLIEILCQFSKKKKESKVKQ
jgi:hypothetical protein